MKGRLVFVYSWLLVLLFCHCNQLNGTFFVPGLPVYGGKEHQLVVLKKPLREISGIDYINDNKLVAINDEAGKLFFINPASGEFESVEFGSKDDYEDVAIAGPFYYVLNSKGQLFEISVGDNKLVATYTGDFGKFMEFESICYDKANEQLLLICKECGKHQDSINSYRFSLSEKKFIPGVYFSISWSDIRKKGKDNSIECKPSAAAINPVTGKLYIVASIGKVLLQCTPGGVLEAVYGLNPDYFPQPEGMTFSPSGDLYISNEGGKGKASLLKFMFRP